MRLSVWKTCVMRVSRDRRQLHRGAAATIAGVFVTRYVYRIEPIVSMSRQEIVYFVSPALHASLTKRRLVD